MTNKELQLLVELRKRIADEDYIGTCGSIEQAAELEREHNALLERIDDVLARRIEDDEREIERLRSLVRRSLPMADALDATKTGRGLDRGFAS